jgi:hypothetical protein
MPSSDDDDQLPMGLFAGPISELLETQQKAHDRRHMALDVVMTEVYNFLDGLNVTQLLAMRRILNLGDGGECVNNNYIDGQVITLLRRVHNVNPSTGDSLELRVPES